ncbi:MAG: hypothetical protein ABI343_07630, partial [Burkholderiaceae bacterium]
MFAWCAVFRLPWPGGCPIRYVARINAYILPASSWLGKSTGELAMAKEELIEMSGLITEVLPDS